MSHNLIKSLGFTKENEAVKAGVCSFCGKKVIKNSFRDAKSKRKYEVCGLCQECQDDFVEQEC